MPTILDPTTQAPKDTGVTGPKIRCPLCRWQPQKTSRWVCKPKCRYSWNTFDTGGVCPKCLHQWTETACHQCKRFSAHSDWYEYS